MCSELRDVEQQYVALESAIEQAAARERRRDSWHDWSQHSLANGGGKLYRWIKGNPSLAASMAAPVILSERAA